MKAAYNTSVKTFDAEIIDMGADLEIEVEFNLSGEQTEIGDGSTETTTEAKISYMKINDLVLDRKQAMELLTKKVVISLESDAAEEYGEVVEF